MKLSESHWPLLIVGSGPAGIGVALEAKRRGVKALMIERSALCNTIYRFPERMTFFSTAELLEFPGIPLIAEGAKPTRREVLDYFTRIVLSNDLPFMTDCAVTDVCADSGSFTVSTTRGNFVAGSVVIATGSYDQPNMLGVSGELLPHVSHYYSTVHPHIGKHIVVVGGKNSAAEAALDLHRGGAQVTLVHRGKSLSPSVKYWIRPDLENRIREGSISAFFNAQVTRIESDKVHVRMDGTSFSLSAESVFLLTGYNPDYSWLQSLGIQFEGKAGLPVHDPETLESNIAGVYVAGVLLAGRETSRVFIENSRTHGAKILNHLLGVRS